MHVVPFGIIFGALGAVGLTTIGGRSPEVGQVRQVREKHWAPPAKNALMVRTATGNGAQTRASRTPLGTAVVCSERTGREREAQQWRMEATQRQEHRRTQIRFGWQSCGGQGTAADVQWMRQAACKRPANGHLSRRWRLTDGQCFSEGASVTGGHGSVVRQLRLTSPTSPPHSDAFPQTSDIPAPKRPRTSDIYEQLLDHIAPSNGHTAAARRTGPQQRTLWLRIVTYALHKWPQVLPCGRRGPFVEALRPYLQPGPSGDAASRGAAVACLTAVARQIGRTCRGACDGVWSPVGPGPSPAPSDPQGPAPALEQAPSRNPSPSPSPM